MEIIPDEKRSDHLYDLGEIVGDADLIVRSSESEEVLKDARQKNSRVLTVVTSEEDRGHREHKRREKTGPEKESFRKERVIQNRKRAFGGEFQFFERFFEDHIKYDIKTAGESPKREVPTRTVPNSGKTEDDE